MTSAARDTRLIVAVVLVVLALVSGCAGRPERQAAGPSRSAAPAGPETRTPAPAAAAVGGDGSYRTAERQVAFTEPARTGPAGQHLGQRTLVTQIWYPRALGASRPFPLLLFAPGFLQCPMAYSHLLQAWASGGYGIGHLFGTAIH